MKGPASLTIRPLALMYAVVCLMAMAAPIAAQRGAITRPQHLNELVEESAVILRGTVSSARVEPHPQFRGLHTVLITLRVEETLKGNAVVSYTFRQYIWDARDRMDAAGYRKGQRLLLLLIAPNQHGLSSPAGLEQGRFRIERDAQGREHAVNGHGNAGLLRNVESAAAKKGAPLPQALARAAAEHRSGPLELDELRAMIRALAGSTAKGGAQ